MRSLDRKGDLVSAAEAEGVSANITTDEMDINSDDSVRQSMARFEAQFGRGPDVLVNNAGYALFGSVEMLSMSQMQAQMNANFFGCVRTSMAVLPSMRAQRSGKIVNVSSIGGVHGQPFNDIYCASKFAVEGMVEAQAPLFRSFGVFVTSVQPGAIRSAFAQNAVRPDMASLPSEYAEPIQRTMAAYHRAQVEDTDGKVSQTPEEVAAVIWDKVIDVEVPPVKVQTNPVIQALFEMKSNDVHGAMGLLANQERFLSDPAPVDGQQ